MFSSHKINLFTKNYFLKITPSYCQNKDISYDRFCFDNRKGANIYVYFAIGEFLLIISELMKFRILNCSDNS